MLENDLAAAFRVKAKKVTHLKSILCHQKPQTLQLFTAPIAEGLYSRTWVSYRDPKTKKLLMEELRTKYKVTVSGTNQILYARFYKLTIKKGFQTLKVQKHATQIHDDLKNITTRFTKHFDGIRDLEKNLKKQ